MISSCPTGNSRRWSQQSSGLSPHQLHRRSNRQLGHRQGGMSHVAAGNKRHMLSVYLQCQPHSKMYLSSLSSLSLRVMWSDSVVKCIVLFGGYFSWVFLISGTFYHSYLCISQLYSYSTCCEKTNMFTWAAYVMASSCRADRQPRSMVSSGMDNLYQTSGGLTLDRELVSTTGSGCRRPTFTAMTNWPVSRSGN